MSTGVVERRRRLGVSLLGLAMGFLVEACESPAPCGADAPDTPARARATVGGQRVGFYAEATRMTFFGFVGGRPANVAGARVTLTTGDAACDHRVNLDILGVEPGSYSVGSSSVDGSLTFRATYGGALGAARATDESRLELDEVEGQITGSFVLVLESAEGEPLGSITEGVLDAVPY